MDKEKNDIQAKEQKCKLILPGNKVVCCSAGSFKWLMMLGFY